MAYFNFTRWIKDVRARLEKTVQDSFQIIVIVARLETSLSKRNFYEKNRNSSSENWLKVALLGAHDPEGEERKGE